MEVTLNRESEAALIESVARRYRERGYEVQTEALIDEVNRVDLLARRGTEMRVVEVSGSARAFNESRRASLVAWLAGQPERHLDLVVGAVRPPLELTPVDQIETHLVEAERLAASGSLEASLLMGWAAFEPSARLRLFALGNALNPSADLLSSAAREGLVEFEATDALRTAQRLRNAIAHGIFEPVTSLMVKQLNDATRHLLFPDEPSGVPLAMGQ